MAREIKFTPFGVPYILEFENVSFVPEQRRRSPSPSSSSSSSFCYIDSPPACPRRPSFSLRSPSSLFKRKPTPTHHVLSAETSISESPVRCANSESAKAPSPPPKPDINGICIRFPPGCGLPQMAHKERLVHLQQTISVAVLDAGMSRSPGHRKPSNEDTVHENRGCRTPGAMFCGTYGQLMAALQGAGLSATPCTGENVSGYTRLGALFVARDDGASGVQLRKITLWG